LSKTEMQKHIKENYKNIGQKILLAHLSLLKPGEFYGWLQDGKKMDLVNDDDDYIIVPGRH